MIDVTSKAICEVMLRCYKDLASACDRVEQISVTVAKRSKRRDVFESFDDLTQLYNEKVVYINVKVIIDKALDTLNNKYELIQKHIYGRLVKDFAKETTAPTLHAVSHRIEHQKKKLFEAIQKQYTTAELMDIISDSKWLVGEYKRWKKIIENGKRSARQAETANKAE